MSIKLHFRRMETTLLTKMAADIKASSAKCDCCASLEKDIADSVDSITGYLETVEALKVAKRELGTVQAHNLYVLAKRGLHSQVLSHILYKRVKLLITAIMSELRMQFNYEGGTDDALSDDTHLYVDEIGVLKLQRLTSHFLSKYGVELVATTIEE